MEKSVFTEEQVIRRMKFGKVRPDDPKGLKLIIPSFLIVPFAGALIDKWNRHHGRRAWFVPFISINVSSMRSQN